MVLAHTVAFFHDGSNATLRFLQNIGDTVCFTVFLFISGSTAYHAYISSTQKEWKVKRYRMLKRLVILLFGYYTVALFSTLRDFSFPPDTGWIEHFAGIVFFVNIPGYTEFLIPFIVFGLLGFVFRKELNSLSKKPLLLICISALSYSAGTILYHVNVPDELINGKSLIAGAQGLYRFPLLQYFPIFLLGILSARLLKHTRSRSRKLSLLKFGTLSLLLFIVIAVIVNPIAQFPYQANFQRWPQLSPF